MGRSIPNRWLNYMPMGKRIEGTRFFAFKVPLKKDANANLAKDKRFDCHLLMKAMPEIGMVIDLTNTNRFYDPKYFRDNGVIHNKIFVEGHFTPKTRLVQQFKDCVRHFLNKNSNNDKLIGVHCTHGVNRTGYMICNYMISELNMQPKDAIHKFAIARGHRIERQNYLDSLRNMAPKNGSADTNPVNDVPRVLTTERLSWRGHREPLPPPQMEVPMKRSARTSPVNDVPRVAAAERFSWRGHREPLPQPQMEAQKKRSARASPVNDVPRVIAAERFSWRGHREPLAPPQMEVPNRGSAGTNPVNDVPRSADSRSWRVHPEPLPAQMETTQNVQSSRRPYRGSYYKYNCNAERRRDRDPQPFNNNRYRYVAKHYQRPYERPPNNYNGN